MEEDIKVEPIELLDLNATAKSGADFRSVEAVGSSILIYDVKQELCDKYDLDVIKAEVHGYGGSENYMEQELHDAVLENHEQDEAEDHMENTKSITDQYENGKRKVSCKNGTSAENNCVWRRIKTEVDEMTFPEHYDKNRKSGDCGISDNYTPMEAKGGILCEQMSKHPKDSKVTTDFKCQLCDFTTPRKYRLNCHIDTAHSNHTKFKCSLCEFCTNHKKYLSRHIDSVHLKTMALETFKCNLCDYSTCQKKSLNRHIQTVHLDVTLHRCELCSFSTTVKYGLKRHIESIHLFRRNYRCNLCDYSTYRKDFFERHMNKHSQQKKYECKFCDYSTIWKYELTYHVDSIHLMLESAIKTEVDDGKCAGYEGDGRGNYDTTAGNLSGNTSSEPKIGSCVHSKDGCNSCGYNASQKTNTPNIDSAHSTVTNGYKCHICDYSTARRHGLQCHIDVVHLKKKKFHCDFCDFSAFYGSHLKRHMRNAHSTEKKYKCNTCDFSSNEKYPLQYHVQSVHLKLKKFKCKLCVYSAVYRYELKNHMTKNHSEMKSFKCSLCDFETTWKYDLTQHINTTHLK